jgi:hypothetical protein
MLNTYFSKTPIITHIHTQWRKEIHIWNFFPKFKLHCYLYPVLPYSLDNKKWALLIVLALLLCPLSHTWQNRKPSRILHLANIQWIQYPMERSCSVRHTVTVESQLQLTCSAELKCLKPHTDVAKNMQSTVAIYIPGFCRVHPAFNSGPKGLMTRQNLNVYFCYF